MILLRQKPEWKKKSLISNNLTGRKYLKARVLSLETSPVIPPEKQQLFLKKKERIKSLN